MSLRNEVQPSFRPGHVIAAAAIAALVKIAIALTSLGTNDVVAFYEFGKAIESHGLTWIYEHSVLFNHPPMIGYLLGALAWLDRQPLLRDNGLPFPFLLRFPGILADFVTVLLIVSVARKNPQLRPPQWALLLFAISPVSIMITGFHGNTDPILVLLLVLASIMAIDGRPALCGLSLALACQVKMIPVLLLPIFFFFWLEQRRIWWPAGSFALTSFLFCLEPLLRSPVVFLKNVLGYGSFWGVWGLTSLLRMSGISGFRKTSFFDLSASQNLIMLLLKLAVVLSILVLAWRRRKLPPTELFATIGYAWIIFFVVSPGVAAQYLVWLAPFVLLLSPTLYGLILAASSIFLFALYTISSGGFPWYFAHASNKLSLISAYWALLPWLTISAGLIVLARNARRQDPKLRLLSLQAIQPTPISE